MKSVYIAAPYGSHPAHNTNAAIYAAVNLRDRGFTPIIPHLFHLADSIAPHENDYWLRWCLDIITTTRPDIVLRLPGGSPGCDAETAHAAALGIEVYSGELDEFISDMTLQGVIA